MKKILILGSGLVSRPGVKYLLDQENIFITVASNELNKAKELINGKPNSKVIKIDVENINDLAKVIKESDIVVSLLPWTYHIKVAEQCLEFGKHLVTASYCSETMQKLDEQAKRKNLLFLNELGLDPGIDHMSAMKMIDKIYSEGGKILHFYSYCGGLPAPENNDNPFGYKFSWSPRGVVLASLNPAKFEENGKLVEINSKDLFLNCEIDEVEEIGKLEVYPNRDSTQYKKLYGLQDAQTVKRGTYRYPGWCEIFKKIIDLDLLDQTPIKDLEETTYRRIMTDLIKCNPDDNIIFKTAEKINLPIDSALLAGKNPVIQKLTWLGLFNDEKIPPADNYFDVLCNLLQKKLVYNEGEKDMVILKHKFIVENKDKSKDIITSTLIDYGIPYGDTAMAKTVSLPIAIGTKLIAEGKIKSRGVVIPTIKEIYEPVLNELEFLNIRLKEKREKI
jgi:saccharopine dehydrogenase (NADP+, L-glutamate forming)